MGTSSPHQQQLCGQATLSRGNPRAQKLGHGGTAGLGPWPKEGVLQVGKHRPKPQLQHQVTLLSHARQTDWFLCACIPQKFLKRF